MAVTSIDYVNDKHRRYTVLNISMDQPVWLVGSESERRLQFLRQVAPEYCDSAPASTSTGCDGFRVHRDIQESLCSRLEFIPFRSVPNLEPNDGGYLVFPSAFRQGSPLLDKYSFKSSEIPPEDIVMLLVKGGIAGTRMVPDRHDKDKRRCVFDNCGFRNFGRDGWWPDEHAYGTVLTKIFTGKRMQQVWEERPPLVQYNHIYRVVTVGVPNPTVERLVTAAPEARRMIDYANEHCEEITALAALLYNSITGSRVLDSVSRRMKTGSVNIAALKNDNLGTTLAQIEALASGLPRFDLQLPEDYTG